MASKAFSAAKGAPIARCNHARAHSGRASNQEVHMRRLSTAWRLPAIAILLALGMAACGDTWRGVKEDTRDNVRATGEGIEDAGEAIERQAD